MTVDVLFGFEKGEQVLQGVVLVQGLIVYWTGLSHFYYLVLNFLVSLLKHGNELSLKLQIVSKY